MSILDDPKLLGRLLHRARMEAGLSQEFVAEEIGVPRSGVSLIEAGKRAVSSVELARMSELYGQPVQSFLYGTGDETEAEDSSRLTAFFRADAALTDADLEWLKGGLQRFREYAALEQSVLGRQRFELPTYPVPGGPPYEQGERLAEQERRRLGLGDAPVRSMITLLEGEGVKVGYDTFPRSSEVSGCYLFSDALGPCVLINEGDGPSRRRFTAAHEYAHFLVDRESTEGELCDHRLRREPFEVRANAFAAGFLIPAGGVRETLADLDAETDVAPEDLIHLMYRFGVSFEAILWRLMNLGWISPHQRRTWSRLRSTDIAATLGYGASQPGESEPKPGRLKKLALEAWRDKTLSRSAAAEVLGVDPRKLSRNLEGRPSKKHRVPRNTPAAPDWF